MRELIKKLWGVRARRCNMEHFIVFRTVILQHVCHVTGAQAIWRRIGKRLEEWEAGKNHMMVKETARMCK